MKIKQRPYEYLDFPPLTEEQLKELEALKNMKDEDIDLSDIPEYTGDGGFYYIQPVKMPQTKIYFNIDKDNLAWLKSAGSGYQKRLNNLVRWARINNVKLEDLN